MSNILVLGLGALGKRHLSSILNSKMELDVYCYDINPCALDNFEWENLYGNKTINMVSNFKEIPNDIDFALFSMTANGRREMFDKLIASARVRYILFEKVLFQRIDDYQHVKMILRDRGIKAWVNCARRQMDCYQELGKILSDAKEMYITVSGGEWGLACNAIHELDLVSFLSQSNDLRIESLDLLPGVFESKRRGYKEVYGSIYGSCGKCKKFIISCMKDTDVPDIVSIESDIGNFLVFESKHKVITMSKDQEYNIYEKEFVIPYQSEMTQYVLEDILNNGESRLTEYEDSSKIHIEFIRQLLTFFNNNGLEGNICPIT